MKARYIVFFCCSLALPCVGNSIAQPSLAPTKADVKRSMDQAEEKKARADHRDRTEENRPRSDNEKFTNSIPGTVEVRPIYKDGGGGVKLTAPLEGSAISR